MDKSIKIALWIIVILLFIMLTEVFSIEDTLKEVYSDTHYTSASVDYLKNIENILEDIKRK